MKSRVWLLPFIVMLLFLAACGGPLQVRTGSSAQATDIAYGKTLGVAELCQKNPAACGTPVPQGVNVLGDYGKFGLLTTPGPRDQIGSLRLTQETTVYSEPGEGANVQKIGSITDTSVIYGYVDTASNGRYALVALTGWMETYDQNGGLTTCVENTWDNPPVVDGKVQPVCFAYVWAKGQPDGSRVMVARLVKGVNVNVSTEGGNTWQNMPRVTVYVWVRVVSTVALIANTPIPTPTLLPTSTPQP
jgi:hypothetical protein